MFFLCFGLLSLTFYLKYSDTGQVKLLLEASERSRETLNRVVLVDMDSVFGELKRYINDDPIPFDLIQQGAGNFRCVMECASTRCEGVFNFLVEHGFSVHNFMITGLSDNLYRCELILNRGT